MQKIYLSLSARADMTGHRNRVRNTAETAPKGADIDLPYQVPLLSYRESRV